MTQTNSNSTSSKLTKEEALSILAKEEQRKEQQRAYHKQYNATHKEEQAAYHKAYNERRKELVEAAKRLINKLENDK